MKHRTLLSLSILLFGVAGSAFAADRGDRVEHRLDQRGDRIDNRLDHKGERIDAAWTARATASTPAWTSAAIAPKPPATSSGPPDSTAAATASTTA